MDMLVVTNFVSKGNTIFLNDEPCNNQLSINNIDYYAYSVSPQSKRNKGAHSYVLALYPSQDFIDIYKSQPQKVIKISNVHDFLEMVIMLEVMPMKESAQRLVLWRSVKGSIYPT